MAVNQQPFSLDQFFQEMIGPGISGEKARSQWFGKKADEATLFAAEEAEKARKKMAQEAGGVFGDASWLKTVLPMIMNVAVPGSGFLLATAMSAADTAKKQKQYKERIKEAKKAPTKASSKYAGTFLQDYIENALSGIKGQTTAGLEGMKGASLASGLIETGLNLIPGVGFEGFGKGATQDLTKEATKSLTDTIGETVVDEFGNPISEQIVEEAIHDTLDKELQKTASKEITKVANENIYKKLAGESKDLLASLIPSGDKALDIASKPWFGEYSRDDLLKNIIPTLTTPAHYTSALAEPAMNWLTGGSEEPTIVRAQNPYKRYRV